MINSLANEDPEISQAILQEGKRQKETINLIASENYASRAVLEAQGSFLTNKYAEGYPGKRYYGGCHNMDTIESVAIERAKKLFGADYANVQPHSGAQANMAAYFSILEYGDTVLGMELSHGGHLTHGSPVNFSGKGYRFISYGINQETERIDYQVIEKLARENNPKLIVAGASAYPRIIDFERLRQIADMVGAKVLIDMAHIAGLVAAGVHPSPIPYADIVTSTTHKTLRGPRGGFILSSQNYAQAIDSSVFPRMQGGPLMHVIAGKAVAFQEALLPDFVEYQKRTLQNAATLANGLKSAGFRLVSGGTDNHLVLVDLSSTGVNGKQAEESLGRAGIVVNRNTVPFSTAYSPRIAAGIRLGAAAVTSRGFGTAEMEKIAAFIGKIIGNIDTPTIEKEILEEVQGICQHFPVPGIDA
ncbi:MAG: serine hydroxymethyltransferase [Dehalococcoidia bacterium]|nr:serine hydroxymethyltransferase [Dehalococcoidia bacterium]